MGGDWREGFEYAWQAADPEPDEGPGLTWRQLAPRHWSGTWESKIRGTVTRDGDGWVAYLRLEDPPPPLTHHHRRPLRHRRVGTGGDGRGVGFEATRRPRVDDHG
jgi:hypothetical protein